VAVGILYVTGGLAGGWGMDRACQREQAWGQVATEAMEMRALGLGSEGGHWKEALDPPWEAR
jgi:hypothetical protein